MIIMKKVAIFGVGLIGGSIALNFRNQSNIYVVGHSHRESSVQKYLKNDVVDHATTSMEEAVKDADFIFLCNPVSVLSDYLQKISQYSLKPGCIITDVGSTKSSVSQTAKLLQLNDVYFIGGHPMAGSERSGVEAATVDLFENAFYVLTPDDFTPTEKVQELRDLLACTRAQIIDIDPNTHDDIVGAISHLPHIVAAALVNQVAKYHKSNPLYKKLSAGGFRDITRIASSSPQIWRDILLHNKDVLLRLLEDWNEEISTFIELLKREDGAGLEKQFESASYFRNQLPDRKKGMIASIFDVYVDVPDHPGVIGQIASLLGENEVSISNIQIIEMRTEVPGVLRLTFHNEADMSKAIQMLEPLYPVHI